MSYFSPIAGVLEFAMLLRGGGAKARKNANPTSFWLRFAGAGTLLVGLFLWQLAVIGSILVALGHAHEARRRMKRAIGHTDYRRLPP